MRIEGKEYRTIWYEESVVKIIDQTKLPHRFIIKDLKSVKDAINAIKIMEVRGAPLIGGTAAYGIVLAIKENNDPKFLERILLDFGVNGNIKKVSHGPVVTLNEFEPAAGVKVSKIINLSDDIARNTSSESARISVIPGSSSVGIELPKIFRENVFDLIRGSAMHFY